MGPGSAEHCCSPRCARETTTILSYLPKRLAQLIPTLFFVSILIFSLQQLLPGDPALVMAGEERDPGVIAQIRAQYRLDQPIPIQYFYWVKGVLAGDFGESLRIKVPVRDLIAQKLPVTMQLASMAIVIAFLIGIPAGIVSAVKKGTLWDYGANLFALWGISTPNFWLGIMLIFLFSIELGWLPASGYVPLSENWRASLASTIMPAFVLGNAIAAILMRHTRSAMLQVLESDYVRTARAKGLSERTVILKHAMRNALTPVITLGVLELGEFLSGAVLTEQIFSIPGFGKLIVDAVFNRDYAVVQGVVLVTATIYVTLNLVADMLYVLVNPRLRSCADGRRRLRCCACARGRPGREPGAPGAAAPAAPQGRGARACGDRAIRRGRRVRAADRAIRSGVADVDAGAQAAVVAALVWNRRRRPRQPLAHHLRRARLAARRRDL